MSGMILILKINNSDTIHCARLYVIIMTHNNDYTLVPATLFFCDQEEILKWNQNQGRQGCRSWERAVWK